MQTLRSHVKVIAQSKTLVLRQSVTRNNCRVQYSFFCGSFRLSLLDKLNFIKEEREVSSKLPAVEPF